MQCAGVVSSAGTADANSPPVSKLPQMSTHSCDAAPHLQQRSFLTRPVAHGVLLLPSDTSEQEAASIEPGSADDGCR